METKDFFNLSDETMTLLTNKAIHIDETELAMADWYDRNALPAHDDGISLTREMIRIFEEGKEPK